ncbi:MAG TPA: ABC transporter permease [Gammaproteobacteria bacterium]|nr:ABC transporter permease [Gammaproteobacteria bacterium]
MNGFVNDLRIGLRQLAAKPGFAAAAILTLALGIGANTAVFSFLSGYLLKPLPYPHGGQLVQLYSSIPKVRAEPLPGTSLPLYQAIEQNTDAFAEMAFYVQGTSSVKVNGRATRVSSVYASSSLFSVLGVSPLLGQTFTPDNMHAGSNLAAVISYKLWHDSFGADPGVIGKTVQLDDGIYRIIGVMPQDFAFPDRATSLWLPYRLTPQSFAPMRAMAINVASIDRLKPDVGREAAEVQVQHAIGAFIQDKAPAQLRKLAQGAGFTMGVRPWRDVLLGDRAATLWLLQGAVLLILLMTCVNVANLLLSRILGRSHEIAIRSTLGASRAVLARQLLGEALCLTVPGGIAGVALCWLALVFVAGSSFDSGSAMFSASLDWRVGLFAVGMVLLTAALVSVLPIRHLAKTDLQMTLQEGSRTSGVGRRARRIRSALVISELALATGLLAMAGLVLHSFMNLEAVNPGFRKDHVLMASLLVPEKDHPGKALSGFYDDLTQRVDALPGVREVAMAQILPLMGGRMGGSLPISAFTIPGRKPPPKPPGAMVNRVGQGYFKALGIPILRGRQFDARDAKQPTAIIDAGLARKYFADGHAIGQQIDFGGDKDDRKFTIIGVVPSVKYSKLSTSLASTTIYLNAAYSTGDQGPPRVTTWVIHTAMAPDALVKPLKDLVAAMDSNIAVYDIHTMHEQFADSLSKKQTTMTLLLAFGGIALALAIVGVYAVMSYAVSQRRAECGVRLALGALPGDLQRLVLKDGLRLLVVGLVIGLSLAVLCGYLISAQLFGVAPFDPLTLIASAIVLCLITLAACYLPARRAAKLDPAVAIMEQ